MRIPQRTCIGCYQIKAKKELIRIVRSPEKSIDIDPKGGKNGRGVYICPNEDCINKAMKIDKLNRAFRISLDSNNQFKPCEIECAKKNLLEFIKL